MWGQLPCSSWLQHCLAMVLYDVLSDLVMLQWIFCWHTDPVFDNRQGRGQSQRASFLTKPPLRAAIVSDRFDPFTDRTAREIRNRLSNVLMRALDPPRSDLFESVISELLDQDPVPAYRSYLDDRLLSYREAFKEIEFRGLTDKFSQALVLWNHGLFFEVHERLETIWRKSSGEYREALKGLIQAAGVFLHIELGRLDSAKRLGVKAKELLEKHGHLFPIEVAELVSALDEGRTKAPKL
jgi:hypothetical protein